MPGGDQTRIRSLAATARALGRSQPLERLCEMAAEMSRDALAAASVSVSRFEPGTMTVRTLVNVGDLGPDEVRWPHDEIYLMEEFDGLDPLVDDLQTWVYSLDDPDLSEVERQLLVGLGKGCSISAPVVVDGELWGELYATRERGEPRFDRDDEAYLEALVALLAGAVSRATREESLERLAYRDALTGLLNRRALDEHAEEVFEVPTGESTTVTVVAVDINRLKEVNDTLGHVAGDQLIRSVARALRLSYQPLAGSVVARVGGDEFTVLVTGQQPAKVIEVANRLCRHAWRFGHGAGVSCGAATAIVKPGVPFRPTDLFAAADRAQYVAKHGRLTSTVLADDFPPVLDATRT